MCLLRLILPVSLLLQIAWSHNILIALEQGDTYAKDILMHFNISHLFFKDKMKMDFGFQRVILLPNLTVENLCEKIGQASLIVSLARSQDKIDAVATLAQSSRIPVIQIHYLPWQPPGITKINGTTSIVLPAFDNYVVMVPPSIVFQYSLTDIFPQMNISTQLTVLSDNIYSAGFDSWKASFESLNIPVRFMQMVANDPQRIRYQLNSLRGQARTLVLVAKTENIEKFIIEARAQTNIENGDFGMFVMTKDVTPFKCDDCLSANMFWIRPYSGNKIQDVREYQEFINKNEINIEMGYTIPSWDEADVSFYFDIMNATALYLQKLNASYSSFATFQCAVTPDNTTLPLVNFLSARPNLEYGPLVQQGRNYYYQNVAVRAFKIDRISSNEDSKFNKLMGNWSVSTGLMIYYNSLTQSPREITTYRVATVVQPPFMQRIPDWKTGPNFEGYCKDLLDQITEQINMTYILYEVEDGTFGTMDDNGNWNGLMGALVSGSADIALAPLSVMAERENDVDFTVPYYDLVGTTILMKKNDVEYSLFKFMKVLEWPVWLCIVAAYVFTSLLLWIFDKFSPYSYTNNKDRYKDDAEKRVFSLKECLWFCMTSLTPQGGGEAPKNISGRLVAATWWLFGFIIIASYTANLAAFLTVSRLEQPIGSLDDLAKQYKIEYSPMKGSSTETYFRRMAEIEEQFYNIWKEMSLNASMTPRERARLAVWDYPVSDKFTNMWRYMQESGLPASLEDAIERVLASSDGYAFIGDATEIRYAALTNCNLQSVGSEFSRKPFAIAVQTGHPLKDDISSAILLLLNQRKLEGLKEKWWNENPRKVTCPDQNDESDGISIQNIGGVFIVILAGIVLSIITLTFEYFYYRRASPVSKDPVTAKEEHRKKQESPRPSDAPEKKEMSPTSSVHQRRRSLQPPTPSNPDQREGQFTYENTAFQYS